MENTENKTNTANVTVMNESGNQSMTESAVMEEVRVHSTPVPTRDSDKTDNETRNWFLETMGEIKQMFNDNNKRFDANDDFLRKSVSELRDDINNRFDMNDTKFNEQNTKFDILSSDINSRFDINAVSYTHLNIFIYRT